VVKGDQVRTMPFARLSSIDATPAAAPTWLEPEHAALGRRAHVSGPAISIGEQLPTQNDEIEPRHVGDAALVRFRGRIVQKAATMASGQSQPAD
jgi:hypothetical protein